MRHLVAGFLVAVGCAALAHAQSPQPARRIVGDRISSNWKMEAAGRTITDTATLTFQSRDGGPVYTIDFIARHPLNQPVPSPGVVDIVVTQHPVEDDSPEMAWRVDGEPLPVVTRLQARRSVVATVSLAEFDRIARAGAVVDRAFDAELEFGPGQARVLRSMADSWRGGAR
jgi:hypothetical protein